MRSKVTTPVRMLARHVSSDRAIVVRYFSIAMVEIRRRVGRRVAGRVRPGGSLHRPIAGRLRPDGTVTPLVRTARTLGYHRTVIGAVRYV